MDRIPLKKKKVDDDNSNAGWIAAAVLLFLFLAGLLVGIIITAIRVAFVVDATVCGTSSNQCELPYKDYLGNCVSGRYKPNGRACNDTCGNTAGSCTNGECIFTSCNGLCPEGNSTLCPDLVVYSPVFGEYMANKTCELGNVCTYNIIHDSFLVDDEGPLDYIWNAGGMKMLQDKCADIVSNSSFSGRSCLTTGVYFVPIGQPLEGSLDNLTSVEPTILSDLVYQPQCIYTFGCATHTYVAGSLSEEFLLPEGIEGEHAAAISYLTYKQVCEKVMGPGKCGHAA